MNIRNRLRYVSEKISLDLDGIEVLWRFLVLFIFCGGVGIIILKCPLCYAWFHLSIFLFLTVLFGWGIVMGISKTVLYLGRLWRESAP